MFKNKTLLITGGTGSFGNAVLKRFLKTEVKEIRIFSRDEKKQEHLVHPPQSSNLTSINRQRSAPKLHPNSQVVYWSKAFVCKLKQQAALATRSVAHDNILNKKKPIWKTQRAQ